MTLAKFICVGCGSRITSYAAPRRAVELRLCSTCSFIMAHLDYDERHAIAAHLKHTCDIEALTRIHHIEINFGG